MNLKNTNILSLEELVMTSIQSKRRDPIYSPQHQKFFTANGDAGAKAKPVTAFKLPKYSSKFLLQKSIPITHRIEVNFRPYLKAQKMIKSVVSSPSSPKTFDLVDVELKNFKNPAYSLSSLFKSKSPIRVSRIPRYNQDTTKSAEINWKSRYSVRSCSSLKSNSRATTCISRKKNSGSLHASILKKFKSTKFK